MFQYEFLHCSRRNIASIHRKQRAKFAQQIIFTFVFIVLKFHQVHLGKIYQKKIFYDSHCLRIRYLFLVRHKKKWNYIHGAPT